MLVVWREAKRQREGAPAEHTAWSQCLVFTGLLPSDAGHQICFCWTSGRVLFRCLCNVKPNTFCLLETWDGMLDRFRRHPPFKDSVALRLTERRWCCTDGQRNSILPGRRTGQTGTYRNLLKEMRLDFCTGQISFPLHNNIFPFLPSSTTGQWLVFPIQNNWFSRCFQADLMLGEPNIWYGWTSKLLWSWRKIIFCGLLVAGL